MANASAKRIASQNENATKNLLYGQLLSNLLALVIRLLLRRDTFLSSKKAIGLYGFSLALSQFIYQRLVKMGTPKRDSAGALVSPGDDLNQPGVTEWFFDVLYIAWTCQVGSAILGEWFWWLYVSIPLFVFYKLWTVVSPMFLGRSSAPAADDAPAPQENTSKRQEKLRKRNERGDPRVKAQASRR